MFWTFNPKREQSPRKHVPFITWPIQDELIDWLMPGIRDGGDRLIDKSREMGATWVILGCFMNEWLFVPDVPLLIVSRKEEYVWKRGNPDTLYWKLKYLYDKLPIWVQPELEWAERHMRNKNNNSVIDGESTNADVGAGGRRQAIMCDEFSRVEPPEAASIAEAISDTTPCRIFNSTPTSRTHPFGKIRFSGKVPVYTMPWWKHPWKARGLYKSPDINKITIYDLGIWQEMCPEIFGTFETNQVYKYSDLEKEIMVRVKTAENLTGFPIGFVADGTDEWRSPWYDREDRRRSQRDKATNIDIDYVGSGDMIFSPATLKRAIETDTKKPKYKGEVQFRISENKITHCRFNPDTGRRRFSWWQELGGSRPPQNHNYIIGCDIALGAGQSNSVASIYDCNENAKVGSWVCSKTSPTHFAEQVYAIGHWVGGMTKRPYLIWEGGGPGEIFGWRMYELGYDFIYWTRHEKTTSRKRKKTRGWYPSGDNKLNLLIAYDTALEARFKVDQKEKAFTNPDEAALREAEDYVFYASGSVGPAQSAEEEGGAKAAHGDRVIADALTCHARLDQPKAALSFAPVVMLGYGTFAERREMRKREEQAKKDSFRWLI